MPAHILSDEMEGEWREVGKVHGGEFCLGLAADTDEQHAEPSGQVSARLKRCC